MNQTSGVLRRVGDYRWLLVKAPDNKEVSVNLEIAKTDEEKRLVGRQAGAQPLFAMSTELQERLRRTEAPGRGVRGRAEDHALRNRRDDAGFVRQQDLPQPGPCVNP